MLQFSVTQWTRGEQQQWLRLVLREMRWRWWQPWWRQFQRQYTQCLQSIDNSGRGPQDLRQRWQQWQG